MKYLSAIAACLLLAVTVVSAQTYGAQTTTLATNAVAASSTETLSTVIDCGKQDTVAVQIAFKMSGSGTGNQTLTFERSVDGISYETLAAKKTAVVIAATGATTSVTVTNIPSYGAKYIKLSSWANADAGVYTTNMVVKYAVKIPAR